MPKSSLVVTFPRMHVTLAVTWSCILSGDDLGALARKDIGKICARQPLALTFGQPMTLRVCSLRVLLPLGNRQVTEESITNVHILMVVT